MTGAASRLARTARMAAAVLLVVSVPVGVAPAFAASTPAPLQSVGPEVSASPSASVGPSAGADLGTSPVINPQPPYGTVGTQVAIRGSGWPADSPVQIALCGNEALNGTSDCDLSGAASGNSSEQGTFVVLFVVGKPPKPCPCVLYATSFATTAVARYPFNLSGAANAPVSQATSPTRDLTASLDVTGSNLASWFGGPAKRTIRLSVTNTGTAVLADPPVTITFGTGPDPTSLLSQPQIGTVAPGKTIVFTQPVTIHPPAFGEYHVKAQFTTLETPVSASATTTTYPWALFILAWLLLQPLLLGLYKRRPIATDGSDDPFAPSALPTLDGPLPPAGAWADDGLVGVGAPLAAVGVGAMAAYGAAPVGGGAAVVVRPASELVPGYRPVFGVTDLRYHLDPASDGGSPTVAPRIVLGGIVPTAAAQSPVDNGTTDGY